MYVSIREWVGDPRTPRALFSLSHVFTSEEMRLIDRKEELVFVVCMYVQHLGRSFELKTKLSESSRRTVLYVQYNWL